jgi:hypothetical protein
VRTINEYTPEQIADGADLEDFLSNLPSKPPAVDYSKALDEPVPPAPRLRKIVRITLADKEDNPPPASPVTPAKTRTLTVPKTPIPPRKRYIEDKSQRPTVQYTEPIPCVPKNPFRAKYIQENIRLRVELEVAKREREARSAFQRAKQLAECNARFREGVAAGYIKGAEAQLETLRRSNLIKKVAEKKAHNQRGFEKRIAKRARREQAETKVSQV